MPDEHGCKATPQRPGWVHLAGQNGTLLRGPPVLAALLVVFAVLFAAYSLLAIAGALGVVLSRSVVRMAVCLTVALGAVSGLFLLYGAEFVAAAQLMVYVGGTIILLIFGVMLTAGQTTGDDAVGSPVEVLLAGLFATLIGALLIGSVLQIDWGQPNPYAGTGQTSGELGRAMLGVPNAETTSYLLPFELISVHLLVVLIGAAYLARATRVLRGSVDADETRFAMEPDTRRLETAAAAAIAPEPNEETS